MEEPNLDSGLEGGVRETVESIVDKYMTIWEKSYEQTLRAIWYGWIMDPKEVKKALAYLEANYKPGKVEFTGTSVLKQEDFIHPDHSRPEDESKFWRKD